MFCKALPKIFWPLKHLKVGFQTLLEVRLMVDLHFVVWQPLLLWEGYKILMFLVLCTGSHIVRCNLVVLMAVQINSSTHVIHSGSVVSLISSTITFKIKSQFKTICYTVKKISKNTFYFIVKKKKVVL